MTFLSLFRLPFANRLYPIYCAALAAFSLCAGDVQQPALPDYTERPEVRQFIQAMAERHAFGADELTTLIRGVQPNLEAIELVKPSPTPGRRNWRVYRSRFVEPQRIRAGVAFWKEHAATLARAEKEFGVPAEVLVGLIGVETIYGRHTGRFPVLDVLVTLSFDYPEAVNKERRTAMFLRELEEYLVWCRDTQQPNTLLRGSYTGAIGIPQFLPSSIRSYAVDYDGDGRIDLPGNPVDAIGSVAHYLKVHGWEPGRPAVWSIVRSKRAQAAAAAMADGDPELRLRMGDLLDAGIVPRAFAAPSRLKSFRRKEADTPVLLVDLVTPKRPTEYHIGLKNFYAITRYNRSFFYAMSVLELGEAVKASLRRAPKR